MTRPSSKPVKEIDSVTIRFAGDSGDGIQMTGGQFATATALVGNELSTLPDYPAEMRAPAGTTGGVSGFQVHFGTDKVLTPGDKPDILVAMNPAALAVNLKNLERGAVILVNSDAFTAQALKSAGFASNPLEDGSLSNFRVLPVAMTTLTEKALEGMGLNRVQVARCKNFFALGTMFWMYDLPLEPTLVWIERKFSKSPEMVEANKKALLAGYSFAESTEIFDARYSVKKPQLPPGRYRNVTGNEAVAYGLIAASKRAGRPLFYGSYPITPASEVLQELSKHISSGVKVFQAEDEIAAVCAAIGASFAGHLAATGTSGPGFSLKSEAIGLAVMTELPLVVLNVQRGGPSTGLPTKTEQSDLLQAYYGRHGECPVVILAAANSSDCFTMTIEACRLAMKYMTPVILLTDAYLASNSGPLRIPDVEELPKLEMPPLPEAGRFAPYRRDPKTLARPWAVPGTPGYAHRIGGLEKTDGTGEVSYDPDNHERMVRIRSEKVSKVAGEIPPTQVEGRCEGNLLVVGWGSTYGAITSAVRECRESGLEVSGVHVRYLNPLPPDLGPILKRFRKILVCEENLGQFAAILRAHYLMEPATLHKVRGQPMKIADIREKIRELSGKRGNHG